MLALENEILEELVAELKETDPNFRQALLIPKIKGAVREVRSARNYPKHYTERMIAEDMRDFYQNILSLARYDYNMIGGEGSRSRTENGTSVTFVDRKSLFSGIIPLSRSG